ncbi:hypothetical protein BRADI_2g31883v3 [Brachypodium distachyon]|uniref:Uncharacterized protein n=1 Tax=Brachypodium distachyon TaxID=15368 RepID=A0A0Q3G6J7_BRADI|nr:hypothetical protein BRADI_2g31883v3 [Brachypodium distachyon]
MCSGPRSAMACRHEAAPLQLLKEAGSVPNSKIESARPRDWTESASCPRARRPASRPRFRPESALIAAWTRAAKLLDGAGEDPTRFGCRAELTTGAGGGVYLRRRHHQERCA